MQNHERALGHLFVTALPVAGLLRCLVFTVFV